MSEDHSSQHALRDDEEPQLSHVLFGAELISDQIEYYEDWLAAMSREFGNIPAGIMRRCYDLSSHVAQAQREEWPSRASALLGEVTSAEEPEPIGESGSAAHRNNVISPANVPTSDLRSRYAPESHRIEQETQSWQQTKGTIAAFIGCGLLIIVLLGSPSAQGTYAIFPLCGLFALAAELLVHGSISAVTGEEWEELSRFKKCFIAAVPGVAAMIYFAIMAGG